MLSVAWTARLANRLHAVWARRAAPVPEPAGLWAAIDHRLWEVARLRRQYRLAVEKGFALALPVVARELAARAAEVRDLLGRLAVESAPPGYRCPGVAEWVREVRHLADEFAGVEVRWGDAVVRVVTGPVTLRGIDLGPFAIEFVWTRLATGAGVHCFDVLALDPHPAAGQPDVVHPHVRNDGLCPGDAELPLDRAVRDGRLADAFLVVRAVLGTYNPRSPYVPLDEWDGFACADCGRRGRADDRWACEGCDADLCDRCGQGCRACSATRCPNCLGSCDACGGEFCPDCLEAAATGRSVCPTCRVTCPHCSAVVPKDELKDHAARCPESAAEEDTHDDERSDEAAAGEAGR